MRSQSRLMSFIEATTNIVIGFVIAFATQIVAFPLWGVHATIAQNLGISATFTAISVVRLYLIRRFFNRL